MIYILVTRRSVLIMYRFQIIQCMALLMNQVTYKGQAFNLETGCRKNPKHDKTSLAACHIPSSFTCKFLNVDKRKIVSKSLHLTFKTKRKLLYLKSQFPPRCKHFISVIKTNQFMI
jgi:hypothetical protein